MQYKFNDWLIYTIIDYLFTQVLIDWFIQLLIDLFIQLLIDWFQLIFIYWLIYQVLLLNDWKNTFFIIQGWIKILTFLKTRMCKLYKALSFSYYNFWGKLTYYSLSYPWDRYLGRGASNFCLMMSSTVFWGTKPISPILLSSVLIWISLTRQAMIIPAIILHLVHFLCQAFIAVHSWGFTAAAVYISWYVYK